jgi:hypothetical protein
MIPDSNGKVEGMSTITETLLYIGNWRETPREPLLQLTLLAVDLLTCKR